MMRESGSALKFGGSSAEELRGFSGTHKHLPAMLDYFLDKQQQIKSNIHCDVIINPRPVDTYLWCYITLNKWNNLIMMFTQSK